MASRHLPISAARTIIAVVFAYCLTNNHHDHVPVASAFSSPSPLTGYHFGASTTSATKKVSASDALLSNKNRPKSYVPDGLTEEQYKQIKATELAQQQKLQFGMWGPRFKQIDGDPDSNWFNLPSLWTGGFAANNSMQNATGRGGKDTNRNKRDIIARVFATYLKRYGIAYLMLLLSTQLLTKSVSVKQVVATKWVVAARAIVSFVALKPMNMLAATIAERKQIGWLTRNNETTMLAGIVAVIVSAVAIAVR